MKHRKFYAKITAMAAAGSILFSTAGHLGTVAADSSELVLRMDVEDTYLTESALAQSGAVLNGALFLDHYDGIASMQVTLDSSAPLTIVNGGFTVPELFVGFDANNTADDSEYVQDSTEDASVHNVALWYGGDFPYKNGVIASDGTSFLSYQIRIPQGTKAGVYYCYVKDGYETNIAGQKEYYTYIYSEDAEVPFTTKPAKILVEPDVLKGDVNCDGLITADDANAALLYYLSDMMGGTKEECNQAFGTPYVNTAFRAADVVSDSTITADDSTKILHYYLEAMMGDTPNWDDL